MRVDARKNYGHLLTVARAAVEEHGADASLREIARKADVGLATLYRHFPTRETLLEALLQAALAELTDRAAELERSTLRDEALVSWFRAGVAFVRSYRGVVDLMATAIADPDSALHASCVTVRSAGARLLEHAQSEGTARNDLDGADLFALMAAFGWLGDQSSFRPQAEHLARIVADAILAPGSGDLPRRSRRKSMTGQPDPTIASLEEP